MTSQSFFFPTIHMTGQKACQAYGHKSASKAPFCAGRGDEYLGIASDRFESGHLIPRFVIKHAARLFLEHAAPLFEEKRDAT